MLFWYTAERPQRILQALGQCHEALAAEDDAGMLRRTGESEQQFRNVSEQSFRFDSEQYIGAPWVRELASVDL
jgi:hypothetical protein